MRTLLVWLLSCSVLPCAAQVPFTFALSQDTAVNLTRPRVFERTGPDRYRVFGGSGNTDSSWTYSADIDASGQLTGMRTLRCGENTTNAMPSCMLRAADGGMLIAFGRPVPGANAFSFVRTAADGTVQWYRNYPGSTGHHLVDSDRALVEKDGHYFGLGRFTAGPSNAGNATTLVELDSNGVCVAERLWAGGDVWSGEGQGIVRTADNGLLTVAVEHPYSSNSSWPTLSVQHWNAELAIDWSNRYSLGYLHGGMRVLATADGGSFITGYVYPTMGSSQYPFFLRLSATGEVLWARRGTTVFVVPQGAVEEPDGGFALCLYQPQSTPIVARLAADGTLLTAQRADAFDMPVTPWGITRDADTGEHLVRATAANNTTYLFRLDADLGFACASTPVTWDDVAVTPVVTAFPVTVTTAPVLSTDTVWSAHAADFTAVDACLSTAVPGTAHTALEAWPVPSEADVRIRWHDAPSTGVAYTLTDALARVAATGTAQRGADGVFAIPLDALTVGSYVLHLTSGSAQRTVRVVRAE
ncbi:MAG: hypothetical protein JNM62_05245 [Flavobacteriales bacterium]|nr:hypothetical protein [Flavobacteriales bacterium]